MATSETVDSSLRTLGDDSFERVVDAEDAVLVEFYTEWCGTCRQMEPALESIRADTGVAVLKVDIESHLETAIEFGAQRTPTFVLFADSRPVVQRQGSQPEAALRDLVETYVE